MRHGLIVACALAALAALAGPAAAQPRLQVLQAEGRADAKVRARIDAAVLALARTGGEQVIPGDITFSDAAAAVGCRAEDPACKSEVLGMLGVDEIVLTAVTPKPGGFEVAVRRVGKGGASREAVSFVPHDKLDKLDTIAPLFARPAPAPAGSRPPLEPVPPPAAATTTTPPPAETAPADPAAPPAPAADPPTPAVEARPAGPTDVRPRAPNRAPLIGMLGGGAMVAVGIIFWGAAASVQGDIDSAPVNTKEQIRALQDLERKGDGYAGAGNLFFIGGLVLGGVSTYYFIQSGRRRASTARIFPTLVPGGGGIAIAIGGSP